MRPLQVFTQVEGRRVPLLLLEAPRAAVLEAQAVVAGVDLPSWIVALLEAGNILWPDDIDPDRGVIPEEWDGFARHVCLGEQDLRRLAGKEWSPSPTKQA